MVLLTEVQEEVLRIDQLAAWYDPDASWSVREDAGGIEGYSINEWFGDSTQPTKEMLLAADWRDTFVEVRHWERYDHLTGLDYLQIREMVRLVYDRNGFDALDATEQEYLGQFVIPNGLELLTLYNEQEILDISLQYHTNGINTRTIRMLRLEAFLFTALGGNSQIFLILPIITRSVIENYINYYIKGIGYRDNDPGIINYFDGTPGTPWENNSMLDAGLRPIGFTVEQMRDQGKAILLGTTQPIRFS